MIWRDSKESFTKANNEIIFNKKVKINTIEMIQDSSGAHKVLVSKTRLRKDNGELIVIVSTNIIIDDIEVNIRKKQVN